MILLFGMIIVLGITGLLYVLQRQKYFYLKTYFLKNDGSNLILRFQADGNYVINQTMVPSRSDKSFKFDIIEGQYQYRKAQLILNPQTQLVATFPNLTAFMNNQVQNVFLTDQLKNSTTLQIRQKFLFLNKQKLAPIARSKVVRIKQYQKLINKQSNN